MSLIYEDLLTVPFKLNGRDKNGMDCYGLCIELCKRQGVQLRDVVYTEGVKDKDLQNYVTKLNVKKINEPKKYCIAECESEKERMHIVFLLDKKTILHMTRAGIKIEPLLALKNPKFYEVVNE